MRTAIKGRADTVRTPSRSFFSMVDKIISLETCIMYIFHVVWLIPGNQEASNKLLCMWDTGWRPCTFTITGSSLSHVYIKSEEINPNGVLGVHLRNLLESWIHKLCLSLDCNVYIPHMQLLLTMECFCYNVNLVMTCGRYARNQKLRTFWHMALWRPEMGRRLVLSNL